MRILCTEIRALCPHTGELKTWQGDHIPAPTRALAQQWCDENKGYLKVVGELVAEVPFNEKTGDVDWDRRVDYEGVRMN